MPAELRRPVAVALVAALPTAALLPALLLPRHAAAAATPIPQPLRVIVESTGQKHVWDQAWFGPLLGVIIGFFLAAGAELLRRRADRERAAKERRATQRLARFDRELDEARAAADSVAQSAANLTALLAVHNTLADIPADVAKALPVVAEGIRDRAVAQKAAALGASVAAVGGTGALPAADRRAIIASVQADAAALLPDLVAEATARASDLEDMDINGRSEAEREAERLRGD